MIIFYRKIEQPIFEEKLNNFSNPGLYSSDYIVLVVYQLHQSTGFGYTVFNKVRSVYFDGGSNREIPRRQWTEEMKSHAQMRENTVARDPKSLRYTPFGKVFIAFTLIVFLTAGILAVRTISKRKKEQKQEAQLTVPPRQGDLYYGYFIQNNATGGASKMLWTWIRVDKIEGTIYLISINKNRTENELSQDQPGQEFDKTPIRAEFTTGAIPGFKSIDNGFNFFAKRKH